MELAFERWEDLNVSLAPQTNKQPLDSRASLAPSCDPFYTIAMLISYHPFALCLHQMSVENGWCGGADVGEQLRDELIDATIDWFYSASPHNIPTPPPHPHHPRPHITRTSLTSH